MKQLIQVLIDGTWQTGPAFPLPISRAQVITCDEILYGYIIRIQHCNHEYSVIDGRESRKIYRLLEDERKWIEIGELPEKRTYFGVASLNGRIYITGGTGGWKSLILCDK